MLLFLCRNLSEKRSIQTFFIVFCRKGRYNVKMLCYALGHQWNRKDALLGGQNIKILQTEAACLSRRRKNRLRRLFFKTLFITMAILIALMLAAYGVFAYLLGGLNRTTLDESKLSVTAGLSQNGKITNIALFGLDSRNHDYEGRSDAIMVASVNGKTGKIKLVSIARDTYVNVPGYGETKINHAYAYGGAELAIQTINENFNLDITDYAAVNFDSLADVIDAMGGIDLEVTEEERYQINAYLLEGEPLRESGMVHLNGPQAVSYARIRKIDSDTMRTERQRKVLECLFEKAKDISPLEYPSYIRKFAPMIETSLTNEEILELVSVGANPNLTLEQGAFPNDYIQSTGQTIGGVWYYVYDIDQAADMLHEFIYNDVPFEYYGLTEEEIAALESGGTSEGTEGENVE